MPPSSATARRSYEGFLQTLSRRRKLYYLVPPILIFSLSVYGVCKLFGGSQCANNALFVQTALLLLYAVILRIYYR